MLQVLHRVLNATRRALLDDAPNAASLALHDAPRRVPQPGARDRFAVMAGTLDRAPMPTWG